jgi:type II secretory pathway pseudopilin PulG
VILASMILALIPYVQKKQARARAEAEIKAITAALETYKADNGNYPDDAILGAGSYTKNYTDSLDARTNNDPTTSGSIGSYVSANLVLYRALSGDRNLDRKYDATGSTDSGVDLDGQPLSSPLAAPPTSYYTFPAGMLLPSDGTSAVTGIVDPFGNYYGYSTAYQGDVATSGTTPTHGYNSTFDLWSTGGNVSSATSNDTKTQILQKRAQWIINWQNSGENAGQ